jgi:outer membrane protein OmpA-like peptidoglycan-associated protein
MSDEITLTGAVPSDAAEEQLFTLSSEFRLAPAPIIDNVTIDPEAPADGGIRVVEYNSVHFDGDTHTITPEHAQQLGRIVALMNAFPNTRVHVIGNTDQHGENTRNFVISQRRAEAVVDYLVTQGIDPSRLSTQPAGESNPLSTELSPAADALNRRTDYVIFGLLDD